MLDFKDFVELLSFKLPCCANKDHSCYVFEVMSSGAHHYLLRCKWMIMRTKEK